MKALKKISLAITFLAIAFSSTEVLAQGKRKAERATREWRYETECAGVGVEGTKLVKVWSYSKNPKYSIVQAKKNAIHGMVFKGYTGNSAVGCPTQRPLVNDPTLEDQKGDYFDELFDGGKYMKFVSASGDGDFGPDDVVKVGKEYKIGIIVSVMYDQLRKDLEAAGVIRGLSSGF